MNEELFTILERIWLEGQNNGVFMSFQEWLHEEGGSGREEYLINRIKEALKEE